jgi:hypothetical protein
MKLKIPPKADGRGWKCAYTFGKALRSPSHRREGVLKRSVQKDERMIPSGGIYPFWRKGLSIVYA